MSLDTAPQGDARPVVGTAARPVGVGRLALVELRRFAARDAVRWLLVAMLAVVATTTVVAYRATVPPTQAQLDEAQRIYEAQLGDWERNGQQQIDDCLEQEAQAQLSEPGVDFGCASIRPPEIEWFLPHRTTFAESASGWLQSVSGFLLFIALIVGATFVAAEFATGSITTWLTFEPRRGRVFASKALVATLTTGLVVLAVAALSVGLSWLACRYHDAVGDVTAELWTELAHRALRAAALGAGAATLGAALAFLLRHTAAAIAVVIGWLVLVDGMVVQALLRAPRWAVQVNLQAWLQAGATYYQEGQCVTGATGEVVCTSGERTLSMAAGGLTLLVLVAAVTAVAVLVFRRRDVG